MKKLLFLLIILIPSTSIQAQYRKKASQIEARLKQKEKADRNKDWGAAGAWQKSTWGWGQQPRKLFLNDWAREKGWAYKDDGVLTHKGHTLEFYEKHEPEFYKNSLQKELKRIENEDEAFRTGGQTWHMWQTLYPRHEEEASETKVEKG